MHLLPILLDMILRNMPDDDDEEEAEEGRKWRI